MRKNFYVFRHGQTDMNANNIWQGAQINVTLNETGKQQALELGKKLLPLGIEVIYTSNLRRAIQTTMLANQSLDVATFIHSDLRECNFGEAEGYTFDELNNMYPQTVHDVLYPTPETWHTKFPGADSESKKEVFERVSSAILDIAHKDKSTNIGISTHGGVMSSLLAGLKAYGTPIPNCCVAHIIYDDATDSLSFVKML